MVKNRSILNMHESFVVFFGSLFLSTNSICYFPNIAYFSQFCLKNSQWQNTVRFITKGFALNFRVACYWREQLCLLSEERPNMNAYTTSPGYIKSRLINLTKRETCTKVLKKLQDFKVKLLRKKNKKKVLLTANSCCKYLLLVPLPMGSKPKVTTWIETTTLNYTLFTHVLFTWIKLSTCFLLNTWFT